MQADNPAALLVVMKCATKGQYWVNFWIQRWVSHSSKHGNTWRNPDRKGRSLSEQQLESWWEVLPYLFVFTSFISLVATELCSATPRPHAYWLWYASASPTKDRLNNSQNEGTREKEVLRYWTLSIYWSICQVQIPLKTKYTTVSGEDA